VSLVDSIIWTIFQASRLIFKGNFGVHASLVSEQTKLGAPRMPGYEKVARNQSPVTNGDGLFVQAFCGGLGSTAAALRTVTR